MIGAIEGIQIGSEFASYAELCEAKVHKTLRRGIVGNERIGAESIVLNGEYDDRDYGTRILYTGQGGRDPQTGKQTADQDLNESGNAALLTSWVRGLPVRVVRGSKHKSQYSPASGYRYSGLFKLVKQPWLEPHPRDQFLVCRFELEQLTDFDFSETSTAKNKRFTRTSNALAGRMSRPLNWECGCGWHGSLKELNANVYPFRCPTCGATEGAGLSSPTP